MVSQTPPVPSNNQVAEDYIKNRIEQYRSYYRRRAKSAKKYHQTTKVATIIGGAIIPAILFMQLKYSNVIAACVSLSVLVLISLENGFHHGQIWRNYRSNEQYLEEQVVLFRNKAGPFSNLDDSSAFKLLVERTEEAIEKENTATLEVLARPTSEV